MDRELEAKLEALVDTHGLETLLETLATICSEKSDHVASNWQDATLAGAWMNNAAKLSAVALELDATS